MLVLQLSVTAAFVAASIYFYQKAMRYQNSTFSLMLFIGLLYPFGKMIQFWMIGPALARWYLADVGWVSFMTVTLTFSGLVRRRSTLDELKASLPYAFLSGFGFELFQIFFYPPVDPASRIPRAAGDWTDAAVFCAMFAVNWYLLIKLDYETRHEEVSA